MIEEPSHLCYNDDGQSDRSIWRRAIIQAFHPITSPAALLCLAGLTFSSCSRPAADQVGQRSTPTLGDAATTSLAEDAKVPLIEPISSTNGSAEAPSETTADAAYDAGQWKSCASQWMAIANAAISGRHRALYGAARCYARGGKDDLAFAALDAAVVAGQHNVKRLLTSADFAGLHGDSRWAKTVAAMTNQLADWEKTLKAPRLRRELLAMAEEDQAARNAWITCGQSQDKKRCAGLGARVAMVDKKNARTLDATIRKHGWPGATTVGEDGAHAAWLIAQHADLDRSLQTSVLARMKRMVATGEVEAADYAYLYDRIAIAENREQLYGTQFNGLEPFPIEDEVNVDARRKAMGLSTMAEYKQEILKMYGPSK